MSQQIENEIKVSVIIPIYNAEEYLEQCLECVRKQTLKEIEIICVNDGSTDASVQILEYYRKSDNRFTILNNVHREGKGAGAARNLGLKNAKGKYILWLDADDWFDLDMVQRLYERAERTNAEIVLFDAIRHDVNTGVESPYNSINYSVIPENKEAFSGEDIVSGLFQFSGAVWNKLFLKSYLDDKGLLCQEVYFTDDVFLAYVAMLYAKRITVVDKQYVHYRWNQTDSQLTNRFRYTETMYAAPMAIFNELKKSGMHQKGRDSFYKRWLVHMIMSLRNACNYVEYARRYECFREILLNEFKILDVDDGILVKSKSVWWVAESKEVAQYSLAESLFRKLQKINREYEMVGDFYLPKELLNGMSVKLAIYGAGDYGKKIYMKLSENERFRNVDVVLWVDRNYKELGYPVQSIDKLGVAEMDYIIIGIVDENIVCQVKDYIVKLGIDESKIVSLVRKDVHM